MTWDWSIGGPILMVLAVNVLGWAFTLGKSAGKARSGDKALVTLTEALGILQGKVAGLDKVCGVVETRIGSLEDTINNGLTERMRHCSEAIARLQVQVEKHEETKAAKRRRAKG